MNDDEWTLVSGKRTSRNRVSNSLGSLNSCANADHVTIQKSVARIEEMIANTLKLSHKFIRYLVKTLNCRLCITKNTRLVALGCGTPTNSTLPLNRSCSFQWDICIILRDLFELDSVDIFDPVMTPTDYGIWNSLSEKRHVSEGTRRELMRMNNIYSTHDEESKKEDAQLLLYMPHCEAFLYKEILNGILHGHDPLQLAKKLASRDNFPTKHSGYSIERILLVGNSITRYQREDCNFLPQTMVKVAEIPLPDFQEHTEAFNNTFTTTF